MGLNIATHCPSANILFTLKETGMQMAGPAFFPFFFKFLLLLLCIVDDILIDSCGWDYDGYP